METAPSEIITKVPPKLKSREGMLPEFRLVIFDLGGTIVDFGCLAPVAAFVEAFQRNGVNVTSEQARGPMGTHKRDHIRAMFQIPEVAAQWQAHHQQPWSEADVERLYEGFIPLQTEISVRHADLIPGLLETAEVLKQNGIQIATTTGFPRPVAVPILETLSKEGFRPAFSICADEVPAGRPAPWMIFRAMEALDVPNVKTVLNVGDTIPDMQAARNAGVFALGVTESGSEVGLPLAELEALPIEVRENKHHAAAKTLFSAGAHVVLRTIAELRPDTLWRKFLAVPH